MGVFSNDTLPTRIHKDRRSYFATQTLPTVVENIGSASTSIEIDLESFLIHSEENLEDHFAHF